MIALRPRSINYDRDYDVLRIWFPSSFGGISYDDEEYPGIYISRSEANEQITGVLIFDYSLRSMRELKLLVPIVKWEDVKEKVVN